MLLAHIHTNRGIITAELFYDKVPMTTLPKTVCLPSNQEVSVWVMKNWDPLVPGPALAMDRIPGPSWRKSG